VVYIGLYVCNCVHGHVVAFSTCLYVNDVLFRVLSIENEVLITLFWRYGQIVGKLQSIVAAIAANQIIMCFCLFCFVLFSFCTLITEPLSLRCLPTLYRCGVCLIIFFQLQHPTTPQHATTIRDDKRQVDDEQ